MTTHLMDVIDEGLGIPLLEVTGHSISRLLVRGYRLDNRGPFIPGEGAAGQPSRGLFAGVEGKGGLRGPSRLMGR